MSLHTCLGPAVPRAFSAGQARADGLLANWTLNSPTGTTSFPDNSGNGHTATLQGSRHAH